MESRQVDWSLDRNVLTFQAKLKDINSLMFAFTSYNHDCIVYMTVRVNDESFLTLGDMPTVIDTEVTNTDGSLDIERSIDEGSNTKSFDLKVLNAPLIRQPVINNTGETILKGTPVVLTGTSGESITIAKLISSTTITEQVNVGIVDADILPNTEGYAVRSGLITMDTNLWTEGDILYASTAAGVLSNLRPTKGYGVIPVGMVIKKDGIDAGKVLVNPSSIPRISQLPDVDIVDPLPNQVLSIDDNGLVKNKSITFTAIKDNAYDDVTDPIHPDNITDIEQLSFFRNVGDNANHTIVESEKGIYGVLIPNPSREADQFKVPMLNNLGQIVWEFVPDEEFIDDKISDAVQNLQTALTFDTTPTADSTNPVTSGGIKTALDAKQDVFNIVNADVSITGSTVTVSIEQGDLYIVDLSEETAITDIEIVLTNNASVANPLWWFKIESGSTVTLSVKIGATPVGWLGSAISNIALGKTIEVSVVDGLACGGEVL